LQFTALISVGVAPLVQTDRERGELVLHDRCILITTEHLFGGRISRREISLLYTLITPSASSWPLRGWEMREGAYIKFPHLHANDVCIEQRHIDYISPVRLALDKKKSDSARTIVGDVPHHRRVQIHGNCRNFARVWKLLLLHSLSQMKIAITRDLITSI